MNRLDGKEQQQASKKEITTKKIGERRERRQRETGFFAKETANPAATETPLSEIKATGAQDEIQADSSPAVE